MCVTCNYLKNRPVEDEQPSVWNGEQELEKISERLKDKVRKHHELHRLRCKGEYMEEFFSQALEEIGIDNEWYGADHGKGSDVFIKEDNSSRLFDSEKGEVTGISCKTNIKSGLNTVRADMSGGRLERFNGDLDKMLDYLSNQNNYKWYFFGTYRRLTENKSLDYHEYEFHLLPNNFVDPLHFEDQWKDGDWNVKLCTGFNLEISNSQSKQYWINGIPEAILSCFSFGKIQIDK
jgi:hypothetical protein